MVSTGLDTGYIIYDGWCNRALEGSATYSLPPGFQVPGKDATGKRRDYRYRTAHN